MELSPLALSVQRQLPDTSQALCLLFNESNSHLRPGEQDEREGGGDEGASTYFQGAEVLRGGALIWTPGLSP